MMNGLEGWALASLSVYGAPVLLLMAFIGSLGIPFPITLVIVGAGALAREGMLDWRLALLAGLVGAVLADHSEYFLGRLALGGCEFVLGEWMWFCSAREGYTGLHWFTAEQRDGQWGNWQNADFDPAFEVGELHFRCDGSELYFGSSRAGGKGGLDIWVSKLANGT